jgi:hypothetical protein
LRAKRAVVIACSYADENIFWEHMVADLTLQTAFIFLSAFHWFFNASGYCLKGMVSIAIILRL